MLNTTSLQCPICPWVYDVPDVYSQSNMAAAPGIAAAMGVGSGDLLLGIHAHQENRRTETTLDNHLRTHTPQEWLPELLNARRAAKPRTVTTAEDMDALVIGTVVMSSAGTIACRFDPRLGTVFGDDRPFSWGLLALPVTVLFTPKATS